MRAAAVQLTSTADFDANLERADRLTRAAAADGAQLVVLPEKWSVLGRGEALVTGAQPIDGPAISWARALARELGIDLVAGSFSERVAGEARLRNTSFHVTPAGEVAASYTKMHLFDVELGDRADRESEHEDAGDTPVLTEVRGAWVGLAICYDLRFPALFEALDAQVFTLPSAFTLPTTRVHWDVLVRARAIEQQAAFLAANQAGEHPGGMRSGGRSMIVDAWGTVLAQAPEEGEQHVVADIDLDAQRRIRAELPALRHRRDVGGTVHA